MEEMIAKWIRETIREMELAKTNQNLYKIGEMVILLKGLRDLRDKLSKL